MPGTDYDIILAGYKLRTVRTEEGGYRRRFVRREIEQNLISQADSLAQQSRMDHPSLYQTSWAGGASWWKPLLNPSNLNTYFRSNNFDLWSDPGRVIPMNRLEDGAESIIHDNCVIAVGVLGVVGAIGSTNTTDGADFDFYVWSSSTEEWSRDTNNTAAVDDGANPLDMVYDPSDGYFYTVSDDDDLERFNPTTNVDDENWITTGFTAYLGSSIFLQNQYVMLYDGDKLYTVDKASPAVDLAFNDGMGPDMLNEIQTLSGTVILRNTNLAISTPEGIYYVKNTRQGAQPVAWIFRVDRDASGVYIGNPIASLPVGSIALDLEYHLGQVIISASPDWQGIIDNDSAADVEVVLYFVGEGGMGTLGSVLGGRDEIDETPWKILGSRGPLLYFAGGKRLWVYDAIRGGMHSVLAFPTESTEGPFMSMFFVKDADGDDSIVFHAADYKFYFKSDKSDEPDTVSAFGDDETHYTLESNYFDFGLPMEVKELTRVEIQRQADDGGSEWTVQVSTDDAAFADILTDSGSASYASADLSGTTGRRFRYKLIYQTKDTARKALEALKITATSGEMIQEWDLLVDGDEILNVNNEVQDEQAFYDNMVTLGGGEATVILIDNMQEQEQLTSTGDSGTRVKIMAVEIIKEKPGESLVRIVVRED